MKNQNSIKNEPDRGAASCQAGCYPFVRCKGCKDLQRARRIWLPYDPDDPYRADPATLLGPLNIVCMVCKHICEYDSRDTQWEERDAARVPLSAMLYVSLPCQAEDGTLTQVNLIIPRSWNDPESWQKVEQEIVAEVPQWIPQGVTCSAGHPLKLDADGLRLSVNSG